MADPSIEFCDCLIKPLISAFEFFTKRRNLKDVKSSLTMLLYTGSHNQFAHWLRLNVSGQEAGMYRRAVEDANREFRSFWGKLARGDRAYLPDPHDPIEVERGLSLEGQAHLSEVDGLVLEAIDYLRALEITLRSRAREAAGGAADESSDKERADATEVKERLTRLTQQGFAYTSQRKLAKQLECSESTINKAINSSDELKKWMESTRKSPAPSATALTDVVIDQTLDGRTADPADYVPEDEVNAALAKLIDEAPDKERAKINSLDEEDQRRLARVYVAQQKDDEPSPLQDDPPLKKPRPVREYKQI
jgi:hypothetical protein